MSVAKAIPLIKIGAYQTGSQIIDYLSAKLDILIIGRFLGAEALGVYSLAKELVMKAVVLINTITNKVALPFFSVLQNDDDVLRRNYCKVIRLLSFVNIPVIMSVGLLSSCIVPIFYGSNFIETAPIVSILSIWSVFICIGNPVGNVSIAKGRTDISFKYVIVRMLLSIPVVGVTSILSITYVAWGQVFLAIVLFFIGYRMLLYKLIKLPFLDYVNSFYKVILLALLVTLCLYYPIHLNVLGIESYVLQLVIYMLLLIVIYGSLAWLLFKGIFYEIIQLLK